MEEHFKGNSIMFKYKKIVLSIIILCGLVLAPTTARTDVQDPPAPVQQVTELTSTTFIDLYNKVINSVVTVIVEVEGSGQGKFLNTLPPDSPFNKLFREKGAETIPKAVGKGSGYIVSADGLVYTNHHVVFGAQEDKPDMKISEIIVVWSDNKYRKAEIIASDAVADVAVLKIIPEGEETFQALTFADSDNVLPGTMVAAIGTPLDHPFSITTGIISGVGRPTGKGVWVKMLQTDAVINKGNSGGPLFNLNGEVIGMNTLIMSPSGFFIGIGYAVPSNIVTEVATNLIDTGSMIRPWIGVQLSNLSTEFKAKFNIEGEAIIFANVKLDGPAGKAGFQSYDILLTLNGEPIDANQLIDLISNATPGDEFPVVVRRVIDFDNAVYEDIDMVLKIGAMPAAGMD